MAEDFVTKTSDGAVRKLKLVLIYVLFILINISANRFVKYLGLPLYIDNIGTLLGAVLGGYLPGIFVGYLTNIINSTADITNMYYAGVSVLIAFTATFLAKRGFYDTWWKALLTIPFLAFFGGGVGSVLTWFIYGSDLTFAAQLWSDLKLDLLDKAITVVISFVLIKILPKTSSSLLALTDWRQKAMTRSEIREARKTRTRKFPLRTKITLLICIIMVIVIFATTAISFFLYRNFAQEQFTTIGKNVATMTALTIDGDRINDYLTEGASAPDYADTLQKLYKLRDSAHYIEYIYVYQIREDGCHVVFDLDTGSLPGAALGDVIPFDESFTDVIPDLLAGKDIDPVITNDTYGWLLTDYEPVYDSNGNCVCYACTDISMASLERNAISFLARILSLFIGFFILILVLCLWYSDYHLTYPLDAMTAAAHRFAEDNENMEAGVERLQSLQIATGDELENLYEVLVHALKDTVNYLDDVQKKGEQIENMQNGLIYILADMVESRDKCTGDHVRKTAEYVRLILQIMEEKQIYPEQINDAYAKTVINSAPLHDVGKIKVPDAILNKPGKLTDEEYTEMKKHTTAGKEIIERAMALSADTGYLEEALNLATYHHEKWNGTGYPCGLKGEEIPLSARIMAISDVFDALVSTRSYKKPFTFEKAMSIIEEGIGTHFDPLIARAFVENADRVREISEEHK